TKRRRIVGNDAGRRAHGRRVGAYDQGLVCADAGGAVVVGVTRVHRLPVPGAGGVELDAVGIGDDTVGHRLRPGSLGTEGAGVVGVHRIGDAATGVRGSTSEGRGVMHRVTNSTVGLG